VCFTVSDVGVDLPPIVEGRGVDALVGEGSVCGLCVCDRLFQRQNATVTTVIQDNSSFEETTGCNQRGRHQLTTDKHTHTAQYHHRYTSRAPVNGLFPGLPG